jgi:predicted ATPase
MTVALHLLGAPRLERDGRTVHIDTRKAFALIAYLAVQGGYQSRDTLGLLLWAENDHVGARGALRRTLSVLNSALAGEGLLIEREAIAFDPAALWCDLTHFCQALQECAHHNHPLSETCTRCLEPLTQAVNMWKGDFLQGFTLRDSAEFDLWQFQQTEHFRHLYGAALEKLVRLHIDGGRYGEAVEYALRWLALDPLHEVIHRQLMQLYVWTGQRSLALRQYHECVRVLEQELGVAPLDETTRLYQRIMENMINPRAAVTAVSESARSVEQGQAVLPLVGRAHELDQMEQCYHASIAKRAVVIVEGEAGVGKTRLVETFSARRRADGTAIATIRCSESETHIAYAPLLRALREGALQERLTLLDVHWLGELARLLPEIHALRPDASASMLDTAAQSRLYEAICQAVIVLLSGDHPGLLLFEDVQWADSATLDLMAYWLRRVTSDSTLTVLTWRSEEVPRTHRLRLLTADYVRNGGQALAITLQRLSRADVQHLISTVPLPTELSVVDRIYGESEGLPLFVHEYLALLRANPALLREIEWDVPLSIHELLQSRVAQVSEIARQLLDAAAVIGRSFDLDLVREASGRGEVETVDGADELQRRGILKDGGSAIPTYEFYHEKLRAVVVQGLSMARKRLLHRRIAQALLNRVGQTDMLPATAAVIAAHFHAGGQDERAAFYYALAGRHARGLYANREALNYFELARALGYPQLSELYQHIGDIHTANGDYVSAIRSYEAGLAHAAQPTHELEHALGRVYHRLGEWDLAEHHFQSAFNRLDLSAHLARAALLSDWSLTCCSRGELENARQLASEALRLAQASESAQALAQAYNMLGILARKRGSAQFARQHLEQSLQLAQSIDDYSIHIAALNNLALTCVEADSIDEACRLYEKALELCVRQGDRHREAAIHNNMADLFHQIDAQGQAIEHLKQAVVLFAQIGIDGGALKPEIWKLTEW